MRIEDKQDAKWASAHGLADQGYPNIPMWDANGELVARVIGFGGMESWTPQVKGAADVSARLKDAKDKASKDPAAIADLAKTLASIPDRGKDALAAYGKIPADKKDAATTAAENGLRGKLAWDDVNKAVNAGIGEAMKGVDRKDKAASAAAWEKYAPTALQLADDWIKKYADAAPENAPGAYYVKLVFLGRSGKKDEAEAVAKLLAEKYPESREAKNAAKFIESLADKK